MTGASITKFTAKILLIMNAVLKGEIRNYYLLEKRYLCFFSTGIHDQQCVDADYKSGRKIIKLLDSL